MTLAKYTTQVRSICESKAGLEESKGFNDVDNILANSWDKIFTTQCTFFDEQYRSVLCQKILKHYYTREIGLETVGLWQLFMNRKLEEIMPYYNQLYESELIQFDPMHNMSLSKTRQKTGSEQGQGGESGTKSVTSTDGGRTQENLSDSGTRSGTSSEDVRVDNDTTFSKTGNSSDAYSDTPQGSLTNVDQNAYLTNYRKINNGESGSGTDDTATDIDKTFSETTGFTRNDTIVHGKTNTTTGTDGKQKTHALQTTENYIESVVGNNGSYNYSRLLQDFRDTFLNIDMLVIGEFSGMFMGLW